MPDTDAVPDASRITPPVLLPGYPNPVRLSLTVEIRSAGLPLDDFHSSLHAVLTEDGPVRHIRLQPGERLDRDFILRFRLGEGTIKTALVLTPDTDGKEGTFALTIVPPADSAATQQPRDVVFVLDRSGSMGGWKIVAARRALVRMVDTLGDKDRFSVLAFDNAIETVPEWSGVGLVAATNRNRFRAVEFLAQINARGGTEMAQPLDLAVRQLTSGPKERDCILVLITDGHVGNEDQVLRSLAPRVRNLRIFTLGIDQAINEGFLRRLATLGGGMSEVVESEDRLDEVMDKIHRRIGTPVLTGLRLEPAGLRFDPETVVPARMPGLFAGVPVCILGRYQGAATGALALQARDSAGGAWAETVAGTFSANSAIASVWARGHIRELEDRFACGSGDLASLEKRIIATSLQFSVLSRFTAFVAVDRSEVVNQGGQLQRITQPVEAPAGWAMFQAGQTAAAQGVISLMKPIAGQDVRPIEHYLCMPPATIMSQKMDQRMIRAPLMIQSMEILQLPIMALQERIQQELQENPVLELKKATGNEEEKKHDKNMPSRPKSLQDYLSDQLAFLGCTPEQLRVLRFLITHINEDGYLTVPTAEIAAGYDQPVTVAQVEEVLAMVQKLEPPGVGARNEKECLLLQLTPETPHREVLRVLISNHLEDIADNRLPNIQRRTGFELTTIKEAIDVLKHLTLRPGAQFTQETIPYVVPDIAIEQRQDGEYEVRLLDDWTPSIYISRRYLELYRDKNADPKAKEYLKRKIQAAQWLMESIEQRRNTLQRVGTAIFRHQRAFLDKGPEFIQELRMQQIADELGVHVNTISRAVQDKWVQTPRGIFSLKRFFGRAHGHGEELARDAIKRRLLEIIEREDKSKPLSDEDLTNKLQEAGFPVARRTVMKCRRMLNIPSSKHRKEWVREEAQPLAPTSPPFVGPPAEGRDEFWK